MEIPLVKKGSIDVQEVGYSGARRREILFQKQSVSLGRRFGSWWLPVAPPEWGASVRAKQIEAVRVQSKEEAGRRNSANSTSYEISE